MDGTGGGNEKLFNGNRSTCLYKKVIHLCAGFLLREDSAFQADGLGLNPRICSTLKMFSYKNILIVETQPEIVNYLNFHLEKIPENVRSVHGYLVKGANL